MSTEEGESPHLVAARGELDAASAGELAVALTAAVEACGGASLDLAEVTFIDSSGLRVLIDAYRRSDGDGFRIVAASPAVRRVLDLTSTSSFLAP